MKLEGLVLSQVMLWFAVIILGVCCIALARLVGGLYERLAPAGALAFNQKLAGGSVAPVMQLNSLNGEPVAIGLDANRTSSVKSQLLFFLSPSCPVCKNLLPVLHSIRNRESRWLQIILATDGDDHAEHRAFVKQEGLESYPYVVSEILGRAYAVSRLPYAVLINEKGFVSALGLVNSRDHLESLFEAKAMGSSTIQEFLEKKSAAGSVPALASKSRAIP